MVKWFAPKDLTPPEELDLKAIREKLNNCQKRGEKISSVIQKMRVHGEETSPENIHSALESLPLNPQHARVISIGLKVIDELGSGKGYLHAHRKEDEWQEAVQKRDLEVFKHTSSCIFGSVVRGVNREIKDLDLLVYGYKMSKFALEYRIKDFGKVRYHQELLKVRKDFDEARARAKKVEGIMMPYASFDLDGPRGEEIRRSIEAGDILVDLFYKDIRVLNVGRRFASIGEILFYFGYGVITVDKKFDKFIERAKKELKDDKVLFQYLRNLYYYITPGSSSPQANHPATLYYDLVGKKS